MVGVHNSWYYGAVLYDSFYVTIGLSKYIFARRVYDRFYDTIAELYTRSNMALEGLGFSTMSFTDL